MKYLLDTCALIDMIFDPDRLSRKAVQIAESKDELYDIQVVW